MPPERVDDARKALRALCFGALGKMRSSYRVLLLGRGVDDLPENFELIDSGWSGKEDKLYEAGKRIATGEFGKFRFLVRLDDDDLINPDVFDAFAHSDAHCIADAVHWFYDLSTGLVSAQQRPWFANTVIHRFEHALTRVDALGGSARAGSQNFLFACDHSQAWQPYYSQKHVAYASADNPLYVRILNPGSITASAEAGIDEKATYEKYLRTFGQWNAEMPVFLKALKPELVKIWQANHGEMWHFTFTPPSLFKKLLMKLSIG